MVDLVLIKNDQIEYIGDYEPELFVKFMSRYRKFNKEMIVDYLINVYSTPHSLIKEGTVFDEILNKFCEQDSNIFKEFYATREFKIADNSRDFFDKKGRKIYLDFASKYYDKKQCYLNDYLSYDHVHHIHPLVYGGSNNLENLIHINESLHEILHQNPREDDYRYCQVAVDHLLLVCRGYPYYLNQAYSDSKGNMEKATYIYLNKIQNKMHTYYTELFI